MTNTVLFDGIKATPINALPDSAWVWYSPYISEDDETTRTYFQSVPWLNRGIKLRADAISTLPFAILKGEVEIDNSADYQNAIKFLPNPEDLLWLVEAALVLLNRAYLFREYNRATTLSLRYLVPTTIEPVLDERQGLMGFKRNIGKGSISLDIEDLVYFWALDPYVEIGPGDDSPAGAALAAAGVLYNVDEFASAFFKRGAIKPTILSAPGMTPGSPEAKKLKAWWKRITSGISKAFASEIAASELKATVIGEGIKELENTALTGEKREDISTALGIPQTLLFSNAANYATAQEDRLSFYQETVVPEAKFIQRVLNEQILEPGGYRWQFRPETLDVFQTDEQKRSVALLNLTNAGLPLEVAGQMLGMELPPDYTWEQLAAEKEERREQMAEQMKPKEQAQPLTGASQEAEERAAEEGKGLTADALADLRRWRKKAARKGGPVPFESDHIPVSLMGMVSKAIQDHGPDAAFSFLKQAGGLDASEQRIQAKVEKILAKWRKKFLTIISNNGIPPYAELKKELQAALGPEIANIATEQALAAAANIGVEFDSAVVNLAALDWAEKYTFELISGIDNTTRQIVQKAISSYTTTPGMTRGQLEELLQHGFNEYRAEMIAVTETTRAYAQATNQYQTMLVEEAGLKMERIWQTTNDEIVRECPICFPLHQRPEREWAQDFPDGPPAHVRCRCFTTLEYRGRA